MNNQLEEILKATVRRGEKPDALETAKNSFENLLEEKVNKLLQDGKRAIVGKNFQASLEPLSECCHLITQKYGEMDDRLAEPAYCYGSALLEVVRSSQNVFANAVEDTVDDKKDQAEEEKSPTPVADGEEENKSAESDDEEHDLEEEEDAQIAHEWLEISRILHSKRDDKTSKMREAETLSLLAELKSENDNLDEAREDYQTALTIYEKHLEPNDRKIATILYQLGAVELFLRLPEESETSFSKSLHIIENNISIKKEEISKDTEGKVISKLMTEIADLKSLIPEIEEKVLEAKACVEEMKNVKNALKSAFGLGGSGFSGSSSKGAEPIKVNTIQVKRKAKPDSSQPEKKPKNS